MSLDKCYNQKFRTYAGLNLFFLKECNFSNKRVLEVGCSTGLLGRELEKRGNKVFGIEISPRAAKEARKRISKVLVGNIEEMKLPFKREEFDVLICQDVLEHLFQPLDTLLKLKPFLKKNGLLIYSVPNVLNWNLRLKFLFGKFEYRKAGILDETHLRFFNLNSAKKLALDAGFKIIKISATPGFFIPLLNRLTLFQKFNYFISNLFKSLFAQQFIITAEKKDQLKK